MGPLAIIIALELAFTTGILGLSSNLEILNKTKHKVSNVLGIQMIAQQVDDIPAAPSDTSSSDNPPASDNSNPGTSQPTAGISSQNPTEVPTVNSNNPAPSSSYQPTSLETPAPNSDTITPSFSIQSSPLENPGPSDTPDLFGQDLNQSPTPQDKFSPNPESSNQPSPQEASPSPSPSDNAGITQTEAVLNPSDLINSPDNINNQSVEEVKKEEDQLSQTADPADQTQLLINFATDKIKDVNNFTKADDFTSTDFAASRFNVETNQAINNLSKLPQQQQLQLKKQLTNFCDQADKILRTVELSVPEESEQDLEMARGVCRQLQP